MHKHRLAIMLLENAHAFARLSQPGRDDKNRLERHMDESFNLLAPKDQKRVTAALAASPFLPRPVARLIIESHPHVAAPFVARSPAIDATMLAGMINGDCPDVIKRAIARRRGLPQALIAQLRALGDPTIDRALELRQKPVEPSAIQLPNPVAKDTGVTADLVDWASVKKRHQIIEIIAERAALSRESVEALCQDATSRNFLFMLRSFDLSQRGALAVFRAFADPAIANSPAVAQRLKSAYAGISQQDAKRRVATWRLDDLRQLSRVADNDANYQSGDQKTDQSAF